MGYLIREILQLKIFLTVKLGWSLSATQKNSLISSIKIQIQ